MAQVTLDSPPTSVRPLPPSAEQINMDLTVAQSHVPTSPHATVPSNSARTSVVPASSHHGVESTSESKTSKVPLDHAGHLVSMCMVHATTEKPPSSVVDQFRCDFIKFFLGVHDLSDQFSPGVNFGPQFKLCGGKAGASTIENDHDFQVARSALSKKKKEACVVSVEFDVDVMDSYRIRKRPILQVDKDDELNELSYPTKIPRIENFSDNAQLHGSIILQLKVKWVCDKHSGEHGERGHCWVSPTGNHIGLNNCRLKQWAASIAAGDATKHEPPHTIDFDGLRDGRLDVKSCGRTGPCSSAAATPDATTMLLTAVTSLMANQLVSKTPAVDFLTTPKRHRAREVSLPCSPVPITGTELHSCLNDFFDQKGIDLRATEDLLTQLEFTPDIISDVLISRLCEVLMVVEGRGLKLQAFAREWSERLQLKKHCAK
ncbi:hypothetical protein JVT61DRAFT_12155 [Boletus reticuloceps]|uniref:Uncharacterized protein n=1 Tax=Boletus reticuloceps TaxID=495285 RepID=A0A8I2YEH5_9AGAM|nr:hypothetical protein JVT61DRAFT_12155 [Boletus reticuloceps]